MKVCEEFTAPAGGRVIIAANDHPLESGVSMKPERIFRKHIALPQEHGAWAFLLSPLAVGLAAGHRWDAATAWLVVGALAAFFARQPVTIAVKVYAKRRSRKDLPAALFWSIVYGGLGIIAAVALARAGAVYLLWLAAPGLLVFLWHLHLVAHRAERRRMDVEVVASGSLALSAPAALWLAQGRVTWTGWLLWLLLWFQAAASIVYAYLRLEQRTWPTSPPLRERARKGWRALCYTTFNLVAVLILGIFGVVSPWLWLAYAVQWAETTWGVFRPAVKVKPTVIGIRQFLVTTLFTIVFILTWS